MNNFNFSHQHTLKFQIEISTDCLRPEMEISERGDIRITETDFLNLLVRLINVDNRRYVGILCVCLSFSQPIASQTMWLSYQPKIAEWLIFQMWKENACPLAEIDNNVLLNLLCAKNERLS